MLKTGDQSRLPHWGRLHVGADARNRHLYADLGVDTSTDAIDEIVAFVAASRAWGASLATINVRAPGASQGGDANAVVTIEDRALGMALGDSQLLALREALGSGPVAPSVDIVFRLLAR